MIYGIGVDISQTSRFSKWVEDTRIIQRFFNEKEIINNRENEYLCQYYASRFAAKEAFGKALGSGIRDFSLKEIYVEKDNYGKPTIVLSEKLNKILIEKCGNFVVHLSLSHEKDYAIAYVIIEKLQEEK